MGRWSEQWLPLQCVVFSALRIGPMEEEHPSKEEWIHVGNVVSLAAGVVGVGGLSYKRLLRLEGVSI